MSSNDLLKLVRAIHDLATIGYPFEELRADARTAPLINALGQVAGLTSRAIAEYSDK
jgi:hypothetical protein